MGIIGNDGMVGDMYILSCTQLSEEGEAVSTSNRVQSTLLCQNKRFSPALISNPCARRFKKHLYFQDMKHTPYKYTQTSGLMSGLDPHIGHTGLWKTRSLSIHRYADIHHCCVDLA